MPKAYGVHESKEDRTAGQLVAGSIIQLWIYAHDAPDDALAFTTGAPPGQPGAVGDGLWGCMAQAFPPALRPPGCV